MKKAVLASGSEPCVRVHSEQRRQCLGLSPLDGLLGCDYSLEICHGSRCHPAKLVAKVGDMVELAAAENEPSSEVNNFFEFVGSSFWYHCHRL